MDGQPGVRTFTEKETLVKVANGVDLTNVIATGVPQTEIDGTIPGYPVPHVATPPGVNLRSGAIELKAKGLCLTSNNEIADLRVVAEVHEPAIFNDTSLADL
ncbi:MAG: hypothetical protein HKL81_07155 [Acidimicrobiaceae bacterium]|nr:hypothetical protein [Acidimicrobiaceae bacterium]